MTAPGNTSKNSERAYIGLGCNLGERKDNLQSACSAIDAHPECTNLLCSSFYETEPMGPADQPDYMNAVASVDTSLTPDELLTFLQSIEQQHGRTRDGERWGPRTLDLDILLYGTQVIDMPHLKVPHIGIAERSFVLLPLKELTPNLVIPTFGSVEMLATQCQQFGIRRLNS